ncbi:MAG: type I methionyl aminopeptidase [Actinobacteria bacterium]|nr:type I methionyl aminopeptidase [Actinomycetota bacterium]MBU1492568.1 type I methionyl aminopeptidase [Actinomycetota bacterium]
MITIKGPAEFALMRQAGRVVARVHRELREAAVPGVAMLELDLLAARIIAEEDCTSNFLNYHGYPAHVCLSPNEVIVHGIPDSRKVAEGDILSLDAGAIYRGWHGDAAITFAIGEVPPETQALMDATERALWAGIEASVPGARLGDVGHAIEAVAIEAGFGVVREYTGHGIGQQMHEEPQVLNYGQPGKGMRLKAGMAIAIEPMFNLGGEATRVLDDHWSVVTTDGSLSAHFEHTIAITKNGPEVLTLP